MTDSKYRWEIVEVPPNLPMSCRTRSAYDDRTIEAPCDLGSIWLYVWHREKLVGSAVFGASIRGLFEDCLIVSSNSEHQLAKEHLSGVAKRRFEQMLSEANYSLSV